MVQPWAHNPQLVVAPDGSFVLYTLGNGTQSHGAPEQCTTDTGEHHGRQSRSEAARADGGGNTTVGFTIHYSSSPTGPWQALNASIHMFPTIDNLDNWSVQRKGFSHSSFLLSSASSSLDPTSFHHRSLHSGTPHP